MTKPKPTLPYRFTSGQRKGILTLVLLIIVVQGVWFFIGRVSPSASKVSNEEKQWLAQQVKLDALKAKADSTSHKIYPFNPNFISDYKGYTLGMTSLQIDKLKAFRAKNQWINSADDFKKVTGVSDSLLVVISPYFKFPDWVNKKNNTNFKQQVTAVVAKPGDYNEKPYKTEKKATEVKQLDINEALEEDLVSVYGIGPAFAKKILRRRADLGAFVSMEQMDDFKEFSPEAVAGLKKLFKVGANPQVNKINVNTASLQQLSRFPYLNKDVARTIITERSMNGKIDNFDELSKINEIFVVKSKIISLYLEY
ncbi:ComEA family DNA-binding protein [Flavobacterium sp. RHBU_3]|uniref:ComEA family DNA-binding protein n=1 Tax=Flavobacterium sp. RHBU_3 TaxID=3391184 RepID=UPI003984BFDA